MPELVRIGNVSIRVYAREHNPPHFHVVTPDRAVTVRIDTLAPLAGSMRGKDLKCALGWAVEHRQEIADAWEELND